MCQSQADWSQLGQTTIAEREEAGTDRHISLLFPGKWGRELTKIEILISRFRFSQAPYQRQNE